MNNIDLNNYETELIAHCRTAFSATSSNADRQRASVFLQNMGENDANFLYVIRKTFSTIEQPEILLFFSNLGLKTITKFWGTLDDEFLLSFQNFFVTYIKNVNNIQKSVINVVARIPCRITKLGWLRNPRFQNLTNSIASFLSEDSKTCNKGLLILGVLIGEIDKGNATIITTRHRKIATEFRDKELQNIFQLSIEVLKRILSNNSFVPEDPTNSSVENALDLALKSLNFDFIGSIIDESSSDFGSLQIPSSWKKSFEPKYYSEENMHPVTVVWKILIGVTNSSVADNLKSTCICKCFELLNSFSLVRRTLFDSESNKINYYSLIVKGTREVLGPYAGILNNVQVFNSFCRLLVSIQNNCNLSILIRLPEYKEWIKEVAEFTVTAFKLHGVSSNGVHFLLNLWSKYCTSIAYFKGTVPSFLSTFIPQITTQFLQSNLNNLCEQIKEGSDTESLLNEVEMTSITQFLPSLFLYKHENSLDWVQNTFKGHLGYLQKIYDKRIVPNKSENDQLLLIEGEISWVIYVVGTIISGGTPFSISKEKSKRIDAEMVFLVLRIIPFSTYRTELRYFSSIEANPLLEKALLFFFQSLQRSHVQLYFSRFPSEPNGISPSNFFEIISEKMNTKFTPQILMDSILKKLFSNLCYWYMDKEIVRKTLKNLFSLCIGYESSRQTNKSEIVKSALQNINSNFSKFLEFKDNQKLRKNFYNIFLRFAIGSKVDSKTPEESLRNMLKTFDETLEWLSAQSDVGGEEVAKKTIGVCNDLRGVCMALTKRELYAEFFEWFNEKHFRTLLLLFEVHSDKPATAIPMLRLLGEITDNRSARIDYDITSSKGLHIFRSTQKALSTYGARLRHIIASSDIEESAVYKKKIKGMYIMMSILTKLLNGSYIPFGAFEFYGDNSLSELVVSVVSIVLSLPLETIYSYPKMSREYYILMEVLFRCHIDLVSEFTPEIFAKVLSSMMDGLQSTVDHHTSKAGLTIDSLFSQIIKNRRKVTQTKTFEKIARNMEAISDKFIDLALILFQIVIFESSNSQFTLTRTLHSVLVFNPKMLEFYAKALVSAQPEDQKKPLEDVLKVIGENVSDGSISGVNRDRFSRGILTLRMHVSRESIVPVCQ